MYQVMQHYRTGLLEVANVPAPSIQRGRLLVQTVSSVVSAGTERGMVALGQKSLVGKAIARPDLRKRVFDKIKTDGLLETWDQVKQRLDTPVMLGYSAAGVVTAIGDGVHGFAVGDLVACGGQDVAVHAEFLSAPSTLVTRVPAALTAEEASFGMVGAIALHAVRLCRVESGTTVAVIGLGLLGLLGAQMLRAAGCRVLGVDIVPHKLEVAKMLGIDVVADARTMDIPVIARTLSNGYGVDAAVIFAGSPGNAPVELAAKICRDRARVVAAGLIGLDIPRQAFFERELELVVSRASGAGAFDPNYEVHAHDYPYAYVRWTHQRNMAEFLRLVATKDVQLAPVITHRFPIRDATQAYATLQGQQGDSPIGIVINYPSNTATLPSSTVTINARRAVASTGDNEIGVGFLGAGLFARTTLLPLLRKIPKLRLVGIAATAGARSLFAAKTFGFEYAATDTAQVITDKRINSVMIATRHDSHARLVVDALRFDKDVFVEKPLVLTRQELQEVITAWQSGRGRLMVGFNRRHSPHAELAREYLAGAAGPAILHCRVNAGDVPASSWVNDPARGGDRIRGELCHFIDLAHYLLAAPAISVEVNHAAPLHLDAPVEDLVVAVHFAGGHIANFVYTARGHRSLARERIEGFRGGRAVVIDNFRRTTCYGPAAPRGFRTWRLDRGHRQEMMTWFTALSAGLPAPVPFQEYVASTLTTLAVADALHNHCRTAVEQIQLSREL